MKFTICHATESVRFLYIVVLLHLKLHEQLLVLLDLLWCEPLLLQVMQLMLLKLLLLIHRRIAVGNLQIKMRQILQTTHYTYAPA